MHALLGFFPNPITIYIAADVLLVVIETLTHLDSYETYDKYLTDCLVNGLLDSLHFNTVNSNFSEI
jgi:hypothetical protein